MDDEDKQCNTQRAGDTSYEDIESENASNEIDREPKNRAKSDNEMRGVENHNKRGNINKGNRHRRGESKSDNKKRHLRRESSDHNKEDESSDRNNVGDSRPESRKSHVWQLFLDSSCSSATLFFKLHLATARSYFNSPTPWRPRSSSPLTWAVAHLLDSFRPGSSSYSPFKGQNLDQNNHTLINNETNNLINNETNDLINNQANNLINNQPQRLLRPSQIPQPSLAQQEENRRRLYLNFGRPLPFYRVDPEGQEHNVRSTLVVRRVRSLQEEVRAQLIARHGLDGLFLLARNEAISLPPVLSNFLFTLPCHEFEEDLASGKPSRSASYSIRCRMDGKLYQAIFATSEADKISSNLWEDQKFWMSDLKYLGVTNVLGLAVDPLTENVFYITEQLVGRDIGRVISDQGDMVDMGGELQLSRSVAADKLFKQVTETLTKLFKRNIAYGPLREEHILLSGGQVLLENQLMLKHPPDHKTTSLISQLSTSLHILGIMMAKIITKKAIINCSTKCPLINNQLSGDSLNSPKITLTLPTCQDLPEVLVHHGDVGHQARQLLINPHHHARQLTSGD